MYFKQNLTFIYKYATIKRRVGALPPPTAQARIVSIARPSCVTVVSLLCDSWSTVV